MIQRSADEAIVTIKSEADEDAATYLRIKLLKRDMKLKVKGGSRKKADRTQTI
jgi:hypothetical protein